MRRFYLFLSFALMCSISIFAEKPAVADENGKMPGIFTVSNQGKKVFFSQGNLQYRASADGSGTDLTHEVAGGGTAQGIWRFAEHQYDFVGGTNGANNYGNVSEGGVKCSNNNISSTYTGWIDVFGGATSGYNGVQPFLSSTTISDYGPSADWTGENANYDWGVFNAISNGGDLPGVWKILSTSEWQYMLIQRSTSSGLRYAKATVNGIRGLIILPDDWSTSYYTLNTGVAFTANTISETNWTSKLEAHGAIFLPAAGFRYNGVIYSYDNGNPTKVLAQAWYRSNTVQSNATNHYILSFDVQGLWTGTSASTSRYNAASVRLVQYAPAPEITIQIPTTLYYTGSNQQLVSSATAVGGTMYYKLNSGSWTTSIPTASSKGTYQVYYKAVGDATHSDSEVYGPIQVQIINPLATLGMHPTAISPLKYTGSAQELVNAGSGVANGTLKYSLDNTNWDTNIPTGLLPGDYNVYYKVFANTNYSDFIPNPDHIVVNIAKGDYTPSGYSVEANTPAYNGIAQPLVSLTGSVSPAGTVWYKLEPDGEWTTEIPTAILPDNYSVSYKVVPEDNKYAEYTPGDSPIEVTIAKGNIDLGGLTLPGSSIAIDHDGTEKTLLNLTPVPDGCTIEYKLEPDGSWTTTPPTGTDVDDYTVSYRIVPDDDNYNTIAGGVTVSITDYPTVSDHSDAATIASVLNNLTDPWTLKVARTIYANDEYNTICLPFALDESALAASPLAGFNRLKTFKGAQVTGTAPDLYIDIFVEDATTIEAGIPYLISYPSAHADIVNPVFENVIETTTTPSATSADGVTFQGMFAQVHINPYTADREQDYLFLGANSQLMWPSSDQTSESIKMRGFRGYFIVDRSSGSAMSQAPKGTRARIMDAPKTTTGIDNTSAKFGGSEKIIENGILYIIRNGVKYNPQGQIVK